MADAGRHNPGEFSRVSWWTLGLFLWRNRKQKAHPKSAATRKFGLGPLALVLLQSPILSIKAQNSRDLFHNRLQSPTFLKWWQTSWNLLTSFLVIVTNFLKIVWKEWRLLSNFRIPVPMNYTPCIYHSTEGGAIFAVPRTLFRAASLVYLKTYTPVKATPRNTAWSNKQGANWPLRINSRATANAFANEVANFSFSLRKCLANGPCLVQAQRVLLNVLK